MPIDIQEGSRLLLRPRGVEGAHDFLGNSANTDLICQAKGEPGQAPVPTPTLETNKQTQFGLIFGQNFIMNLIPLQFHIQHTSQCIVKQVADRTNE